MSLGVGITRGMQFLAECTFILSVMYKHFIKITKSGDYRRCILAWCRVLISVFLINTIIILCLWRYSSIPVWNV